MLGQADCGRAALVASGAVVAGLMTTASAAGAPVRWVNPAGGHFGDSGNWSPFTAPGRVDDVIFDLAAAYAVAGDASAKSLSIEAGVVQFDLSTSVGNEFDLWRVAGGAGQSATATLTGRALATGGLEVGAGAGATGAMRISGPNGAFLGFDSVVVGRAGEIGSGALVIEGGARLSDVMGLGEATIHGAAEVSGAGSLFRARKAVIGGDMSIASGASASVEFWTVRGRLDVTASEIAAESGLAATSGAAVTLTRGALHATLGEASFHGAALTLNQDASIRAFSMSFANSVLEVGVDASSFEAGEALIAAQMADFSASTLRIALLDAFVPAAGASLHLLSIGHSAGGVFASPFESIELAGEWESGQARMDIVARGPGGGYDAYVTFIPAPGAGALLALGASGALMRRRRSR